MAVLSTTLCYPSPANPTQGIFVQRRLREISRLMPLHVIVPVPWFPLMSQARVPFHLDTAQAPTVSYVRMPYLPGLFKRLDARHYARSLTAGINQLETRSTLDRIDLIDAHFEWPDGVGAWRVARKLGFPFVCTLRGKLVSALRRPAIARQVRDMLLDADALIAVSKSLAILACEATGKDLNVRVIPNGIDAELFKPPPDLAEARRLLGWDPSARYVVSVGHMQELKGFHHLVRIWPEVRKRAGDVRLIMIGGSAGEHRYESSLRRGIADQNLLTTVTLADRLPPQRVAEILGAADLFVSASRSEGWCNAIAESLACGCPVVATDVGGNAEVMNDWGLGRLIPFGRWDTFSQAICESLEQQWDRAVIAAYGRRRSWQQVAAECVDVFNTLVGRTTTKQ